MTLIEFFVSSVAENICSSLAHTPDRVILVGHNKKSMEKHAARYSEFFEKRGFKIDFSVKAIDNHNVATILEAFTEIVEQNEDCVFDLTGGDELYIFAAGMICERFKDKHVQMHFINISNSMIYDCDMDGSTMNEELPLEFTVEDNAYLYGGKVVKDDAKSSGMHKWSMTADFEQDIIKMWDICRENCRAWNSQIDVLQALKECSSSDESGLILSAPKSTVEQCLKQLDGSKKFYTDRKILGSLLDAGLIKQYSNGKYEDVLVEFKNEQVKRALTKSGQVLELRIYLAALRAKTFDGKPIYNDVQTGVLIDWDSVINEERLHIDVENEIDVMMMHGMVPVFVSCKNGDFKVEELYKLNTVANRFGGKYAKKVLIAHVLSDEKATAALRNRCKELNILPIDDADKLTEAQLDNVVKQLWSVGTYAKKQGKKK